MRRGLWDSETVATFMVLASLPLTVSWLAATRWDGAATLLVTALIVYGWQLAFLLLRAQPPSLSGLVTALAIAILAPSDLGPFPFLLGVSFGVVMGELVFGGWGRNIVHPAVVSVALLGFGFPTAPWPELFLPVAWGGFGTLFLLVTFGIASARIVAGSALVLGLYALARGDIHDPWTLPAVTVVLALIVVDPVASASTQLGRWLQGLLFGALVSLFLEVWSDAPVARITIAAALIANLAAPLMDEIALALWRARRRRTHG